MTSIDNDALITFHLYFCCLITIITLPVLGSYFVLISIKMLHLPIPCPGARGGLEDAFALGPWDEKQRLGTVRVVGVGQSPEF